MRSRFDQALLALGRLDSVVTLLPDTALFLYMYVRKEAVLSSMIEGMQSSLSDLLLFELDQVPAVPLDDVREVSNYVAALDHGLRQLEKGLPLSLRLLREVHGVLLAKGRGSNLTPKDFRRSQNWIGGTRPGNAAFVPPPAEEVVECMGKLELFLQDQPEPTPVLLKAAWVHVQLGSMCSSRRSIRSLMVTAAWDACSSHCSCVIRKCCGSRCSISASTSKRTVSILRAVEQCPPGG